MKFSSKLMLDSKVTKSDLLNGNFLWEGWSEKRDDQTVSYRLILNGDKMYGDIYLIIDFMHPNDPGSLLSGWRCAPEKLLIGEQKKAEGKVTKNLRAWFKEKTNITIPILKPWWHIDAAYDPHNSTGTIVCNYRQGFKDDKEWERYCGLNNV